MASRGALCSMHGPQEIVRSAEARLVRLGGQGACLDERDGSKRSRHAREAGEVCRRSDRRSRGPCAGRAQEARTAAADLAAGAACLDLFAFGDVPDRDLIARTTIVQSLVAIGVVLA